MTPEKLIDEKVAVDRDLQEGQQTFKLWVTSSVAKKIVLAQARVRKKSNALQQMVYRHTISDSDRVKRLLFDCWAQRSQDTLNRAIDQLPKRLIMVIKARVRMLNFV